VSATERRFPLYGGRPCLNLIATLGRRHADPVERLPDQAAFAAWLVEAEILPGRQQPAGRLDEARRLREVINRLVRAAMAGRPSARADVRFLNEVAARPDLSVQLSANGRGRRVTWGDRDPVAAALATVARDAVALLSGDRTRRIKECEHADCSLLFFDDSQSGRRRWCSMDRCGNLVKTSGYRQRTHA
jgi:predicted RNA-binding Zn ribbon-like protein